MAEILDLDALAREHEAWLQQIWAANQDLEERMAALGVMSELDPELDTLFVRIGPSQDALTESASDWLGLRVDPDTLKLVGFEVLGAVTNALRVATLVMVVGLLVLVRTVQERRTRQPVPIALYAQLAGELRQLAMAA